MIRDTLKKAAGLFVEFEEEPTPATPSKAKEEEWNVMTATAPEAEKTAKPAAKSQPRTVEQIVKEAPGPNLDEIKVPDPAATAPARPVLGEDGNVDYSAIYELAKLPASPFTAEQILELMATLPAELPMETKRQTVKVTLGAMAKTMGVTVEQIVADASRKLAALAAYSDGFTQQANDYTAKTELEISALELQIAEKRKAIEEAKSKQTVVTQACASEADRLDDVLEFFSLDVPPSKLA